MTNCELIVRDVGSSRLWVIKALKEVIQRIGLKEAKEIIDSMPIYREELFLKDAKRKVEEITKGWKSSPNRSSWEIFITDDGVFHFKFFGHDDGHDRFKYVLENIPESISSQKSHRPMDFTFIGNREKRENKLKNLLDD